MDEIRGFLAGTAAGVEPEGVLTTVLHVAGVDREVAAQHLATFRGRPATSRPGTLLATFDGPARAIRCAHAIVAAGGPARAGLHTGECAFRGERVDGPPVMIAATAADAAEPGEVVCTSTVRDLVAGSGLRFEARGTIEAPTGEETREWPVNKAL